MTFTEPILNPSNFFQSFGAECRVILGFPILYKAYNLLFVFISEILLALGLHKTVHPICGN